MTHASDNWQNTVDVEIRFHIKRGINSYNSHRGRRVWLDQTQAVKPVTMEHAQVRCIAYTEFNWRPASKSLPCGLITPYTAAWTNPRIDIGRLLLVRRRLIHSFPLRIVTKTASNFRMYRATVIANMHKNLAKIALWFLIYRRGQTDTTHTNRHTHYNTSAFLTGAK